MVKKMLPESIIVVGEESYTIEGIADYFSDADDVLLITAVSGVTDVAAVPTDDNIEGDLVISKATGSGARTGISKITVTATESDPPDGTVAQTVAQSFTIEFK